MSERHTEYVLVGRVLRPHGVKGEVAVEVESDVAGRFDVGSQLMLAGGTTRRPVTVAAVRRHHGRLLLRFPGIDDREAAERLRGRRLEVSVDRVPPAPPDSYYYFELVGCRCRDRVEGLLGTVADVVEDGGGILLEVEGKDTSLLVPFVRSFVLTVDLERRLIELDLPPGLIATCASPS